MNPSFPTDDPATLFALAGASFAAGAVNAIAGGGTILTFPVLAAILPADPARLVAANATSTIGLWPASVVAAWAFRGNRAGLPSWARWLVVPSVLGAVVGTLLVLRLPPAWFAGLVPWLILLAAVLFTLQPRVAAWARAAEAPAAADSADAAARLPAPDRLRPAAARRHLRGLLRRRDRHPDARAARRFSVWATSTGSMP